MIGRALLLAAVLLGGSVFGMTTRVGSAFGETTRAGSAFGETTRAGSAFGETRPTYVGRVSPKADPATAPVPVHRYEVVHVYPHDAQAFTQGLLYRDGFLYESTGLKGRSSVRKVRLDTGVVVQQRTVDGRYFAEGLTDWRDRLIQLTWETEIGFVYDKDSLRLQTTWAYRGEGWGLTHDDRRLIMSDGTSALRFLDPETLKEIGRVSVTDEGRAVERLNELEYVRGRVYANVWLTDRIAIIDPATGHVESWVDLTNLRGPSRAIGDDVLNGIAYDAAEDRLFVTGKLWPTLYEIRLR